VLLLVAEVRKIETPALEAGLLEQLSEDERFEDGAELGAVLGERSRCDAPQGGQTFSSRSWRIIKVDSLKKLAPTNLKTKPD
jgi:hypothetical protein